MLTMLVQSNMLRTLSSIEKYKTNIDDVRGKRKFSRNILQWCKITLKVRIAPMETTGLLGGGGGEEG